MDKLHTKILRMYILKNLKQVIRSVSPSLTSCPSPEHLPDPSVWLSAHFCLIWLQSFNTQLLFTNDSQKSKTRFSHGYFIQVSPVSKQNVPLDVFLSLQTQCILSPCSVFTLSSPNIQFLLFPQERNLQFFLGTWTLRMKNLVCVQLLRNVLKEKEQSLLTPSFFLLTGMRMAPALSWTMWLRAPA